MCRACIAPSRSGTPRWRAAGVSDESSRARADDYRAHLQGPVANRIAVQGPETKSPREDVRGYLGLRAAHSDLDGPDRVAAAQVPAAQSHVRLVPVQSRRAAPDESICLS